MGLRRFYSPDAGDTNVNITNWNDGSGSITGRGYLTAAYLAKPNTMVGKYTAVGTLVPAPGTKVEFEFESKYGKPETKEKQLGIKADPDQGAAFEWLDKNDPQNEGLQGGANIVVRSKCLSGISGYPGEPGPDGLCIYQIKSTSVESLSLYPTPAPPTATFIANATIEGVTRDRAVRIANKLQLQLTMYDVADGGAHKGTLSIQVTDKTHGLWFSNNWTGARTSAFGTAPVIKGGRLEIH